MSTDAPPQVELLAIAFLVEASLTLSYEWKRLFQDYVVQLLQRCNIAPGTNKLVRVAFVTYGTADTLPSPIVKKIYFTELRYIIQDVKDDSRRLGIGQTDSGGSKGMAALEGFATVLDMFDFLRTMGLKDPDYRVVHIAASPPDSSEHPHWNTSPSLDSLTWEALPAELKKRNIQLSGINISSGLPRFPELYTKAATGSPTPPWFSVKAQHHVFLNGFASVQAQPKAKRVGEPVAVERTPETKRARVASIQAATEGSPLNLLGQTPPTAPATAATSPPATSNANTNVPKPPPQPTSQPAASPAVQPQIRQQIMQQAQFIITKRKQLEEEFKALAARKQSAMAQGNGDLSNQCDIEINKRKEQFVRLNQALVALQQQARRVQSVPQSTNPQGHEGTQTAQTNPTAPAVARAVTSPGTLSKEPQTPFKPNPATTPRPPPNVQSPSQNPQITPVRSISASGVPTSPSNPGVGSPPNNLPPQPTPAPIPKPGVAPASINAQMQKLLELKRNQQIPLGASMAPSTSAQGSTSMTSSEMGNNNNNGAVSNPAPQPIPPTAQNPNSTQVQPILVWEGILSFNGTGSDGNKKEVRTGVSASSSNASNSRADTWPSTLTLLPAPTPAVSLSEFQEWIRRTKPVLCTFKARTPDDETNYQMLVSVMSSKGMYATASWTLPNGSLKENVLIFPINNMGLCGAFFPLTGIPEMPKAPSVPAPQLQIPPAMLNLISQLPLEQRNAAIAQIRQKIAAGPEVAANFFRAFAQRQLQQQQLQQNAQNRVAMANQFGLNPALGQMGTMGNGTNFMNMMGMNPMNGSGVNPLMNMGNPSTMLPNMARTTTGGGSGASMNLNYDVLQSFMQRNNPDGNNASGMGPG